MSTISTVRMIAIQDIELSSPSDLCQAAFIAKYEMSMMQTTANVKLQIGVITRNPAIEDEKPRKKKQTPQINRPKRNTGYESTRRLTLGENLAFTRTCLTLWIRGAPQFGQECALLEISWPQSLQETRFSLPILAVDCTVSGISGGANGFHSEPFQMNLPSSDI